MSERSIDEVLARQWAAFRGWLDRPQATESLERPSVLEGWAVRDLIAHVGRCFTTIPTATPVMDVAPLSLYGCPFRRSQPGGCARWLGGCGGCRGSRVDTPGEDRQVRDGCHDYGVDSGRCRADTERGSGAPALLTIAVEA